ncbi:hypothetical protein ACIPY6_40880 [Streptomyces sp. NPDC090054]|uniref:hypothetical protein n=1 Tax=Streptomyces sp. NPDC090054 TaxID=3365933 RepID=UPI0038024178
MLAFTRGGRGRDPGPAPHLFQPDPLGSSGGPTMEQFLMPVPPLCCVVSAVAVACLSVLMVTSAAHAAGPAPDGGGELVVLSNEEYAKRFGPDPCRWFPAIRALLQEAGLRCRYE